MNDPTLSRPMFQQTPSAAPAPMVPTVGIGSMTTPDQNAQALRNMFSPQAFKRGGEVINGVAHFADGEEVVVPPPSESVIPARRYGTVSTGQRYGFYSTNKSPEEEAAAAYDQDVRDQSVPRTVSPFAPGSPAEKSYLNRQAAAARLAEPNARVSVQRNIEGSPEGAAALAMMQRGRETGDTKLVQEGAAALERLSGRAYSEAGVPEPASEPLRRPGEVPPVPSTPPVAGGIGSLSPEARMAMEDKDRLDVMRPGGMYNIGSPAAAAPAVPPPNKKDEPISTNLETIKARREASDKQRDENKWMGLLAAGLGMMASKSRTAAGGIGEGGLQGLQTFAGLEKARREEEANLRREDYQQQQLALQNKQFGLAQEQLAQQKQIAMAQLEKDPDTVRLYRALGGGDLMKGYQLASSDATLKSAQLIAADPMADETSKAQARAYLNNRIAEASGARGGGGQTPPAGSKIIPLNQLGR